MIYTVLPFPSPPEFLDKFRDTHGIAKARAAQSLVVPAIFSFSYALLNLRVWLNIFSLDCSDISSLGFGI